VANSKWLRLNDPIRKRLVHEQIDGAESIVGQMDLFAVMRFRNRD
jgi:hypothetical protein